MYTDTVLTEHMQLKPVQGCPQLCAWQCDNVFAMWEACENASGQEFNVPFWAAVWPAGAACARYLLNNPHLAEGRCVLDLGCGGAIEGIAAARCGARTVIANDIDPTALQFASLNALANTVRLTVDERNLISTGLLPDDVDLIIVADLFYQRLQANQTIDYLINAAAQGIRIIIADGQRTFAPRQWGDVVAVESMPVNRELEGVDSREVRILSIKNHPYIASEALQPALTH